MGLLFISIRFLDILDILVFAFLLYQVYNLIKGTAAINIFAGVFGVYLLWLLVRAMNMQLLNSVLGLFFGVGVIAVIIVFQPELRRGFLLLGSKYFTQERFPILRHLQRTNDYYSIKVNEIVIACRSMSMTNTGALIVIQKSTSLKGIIKVKEIIDANTTTRLLLNIFFKNSPLHDGAVIIDGASIHAARCILPLSEKFISGDYGMRHRAAIGITEITDAVCVAVSEETGIISFVKEGIMKACKDSKELQILLEEEFYQAKESSSIEKLFEKIK